MDVCIRLYMCVCVCACVYICVCGTFTAVEQDTCRKDLAKNFQFLDYTLKVLKYRAENGCVYVCVGVCVCVCVCVGVCVCVCVLVSVCECV